MKKITLIYIIFISTIILFTAYLSIKIINKEINNLPFVGRFFTPMGGLEGELEKDLERYASVPEDKRSLSIKRNSEDFKDYEFSMGKPNNTFRIIALGDSFTEGEFVAMNSTWPKQLEKKLNQLNTSTKFEVFNFGISGAGTLEEVKIFEEKGLKYKPGMVILAFNGHDWQDSLWIRNRSEELKKDFENGKLRIPEKIQNKSREIGISEKDTISVFAWFTAQSELWAKWNQERPEVWQSNVEKPLLHLIDLCKSENAKLIIICWDIEDYQLELLKNFLNNNNIQVEDFSQSLSFIQKLRVPDGHLSELGYDIVSNKTLEIVLPYLR